MSDIIIEAKLRETTGRSEARRMRHAGFIPAIIYGGNKPDLPITLSRHYIKRFLNQESFFTSMISIDVDGKRGSNNVLLKEVQWHPVSDEPMHLDFVRVAAGDTVTVTVPVVVINVEQAPGSVAGGSVDLIRHSLDVSCHADSIPESVIVDCANLNIGDTVHIEDLSFVEGLSVPHDVNFTVLNMSAPTKAEASDSDTTSEESSEEA